MNILLTACGGPSAICFAKSLGGIEGVRLIGANAEDDAISETLLDRVYIVPLANDPEYLKALRKIIIDERIDYILPFVDEEVVALSENADSLACKIIVSPFDTIRYTSNKRRAYERLGKYLPKLLEKDAVTSFPVFAKPSVGRGGKGASVINNHSELAAIPPDTYVVQELLSQPEVSVDALFDFDGNLIVAVPRVRAVVDQGISVEGTVFHDAELLEMIESISNELAFIGPINFQFMRDSSGYRLTEINARGSGGMGITIQSGADIPKLTLELMANGFIHHIPDVHEGTFANFEEVLERQRRKKALEDKAV